MEHNQKCRKCGGEIPKGKRGDAVYCSEKCRKSASRQRKEKSAKNRKAPSLSGLPETLQQKTKPESAKPVEKIKPFEKVLPLAQPEKESPLTFSMMPPLRGYVEDVAQVNVVEVPPAPEPFNEPKPEVLKKEFRSYIIEVPNPKYQELRQKREQQVKAIDSVKLHIAWYEQDLKRIQASTNIDGLHYVLSGAGGIFIGANLFDSKVAGSIVGGALGLAFMRLIQFGTEDEFQKQKAEAIKKRQGELDKKRALLKEYEDVLFIMDNALSKATRLLPQQQTRQVNGLEIMMRDDEIKKWEKRKKKRDEEIEAHKEKYGDLQNVPTISIESIPPAQVKDDDVISSLGLNQVVGGAFQFKGAWKDFLGAPSRDFRLLLHGPSFSGKSHFALQLGYYLAVHHGTVLYNTSEEGFSRTMDQKLERLGARAEGFDISKFATAKELMEKIPRTAYNFIILDSVNDMHMTAADLQELRSYYCCSAILGICQNTKDGGMRGGEDLKHWADIKLCVENGIAETQKNRFLEGLPKMEVFKIEPVPPTKTPATKPDPKPIPPTGNNVQEKKQQEPSAKPKDDNEQKGWDNLDDLYNCDHII